MNSIPALKAPFLTANPEKLRRILRQRGMTLERLAQRVGTSVLYAALFAPGGSSNRFALVNLCIALRCRLEELTDFEVKESK